MNTLESFLFHIEVRDKDGKRIKDENGTYHIDYSFEKRTFKNIALKELKALHTTLKAWMPENKVDVTLRYFDSISMTYTAFAEARDGGFVEFK